MALVSPSLEAFRTEQERAAWLNQDYRRSLTFCILHNPLGAYQVTKSRYPAFPNWGRGSEQTEAAQKRLYDFLEEQARMTGQPERFVAELMLAVPRNPAMDNLWIQNS